MGLFRNGTEVDIATSLSAVECTRRLRENTDPLWKIWGRPVVGDFKKASRASLRKRIYYSNPLQTILRVEFDQTDSGTLLRCRPGIGTFIKVIISVWLSIFLLAGGVFFAVSIYDMFLSIRPIYERDVFGVIGFWGVLLFAVGLYLFGRWMSRRDREYLVKFVENTVSGRSITNREKVRSALGGTEL